MGKYKKELKELIEEVRHLRQRIDKLERKTLIYSYEEIKPPLSPAGLPVYYTTTEGPLPKEVPINKAVGLILDKLNIKIEHVPTIPESFKIIEEKRNAKTPGQGR